MPHPESGEEKKDFMKRCIPYVIHEGTAAHSKQAAAICYSIWDRENKIGDISEKEYKRKKLCSSDKAKLLCLHY